VGEHLALSKRLEGRENEEKGSASMIYNHLVRHDGVNVPGGRVQSLPQTGIIDDPIIVNLNRRAVGNYRGGHKDVKHQTA